MDSTFIRHSPCEECGSSDALGEFDDGHTYCFSCGAYTPGSSGSIYIKTKTTKKETGDLTLPADFTYHLPSVVREWLEKYGITDHEIFTKRLGWSQKYESLVYPSFAVDGHLEFYQCRSFAVSSDRPRFITRGVAEDTFHIIGDSSSSVIVVVEDFISCLKVGRIISTCPLWGSTVSTQRLARLGKLYSQLVIWLDKDKEKYSITTRERASPFFERVSCIVTDRDPKDYNNQQIKGFVECVNTSSIIKI